MTTTTALHTREPSHHPVPPNASLSSGDGVSSAIAQETLTLLFANATSGLAASLTLAAVLVTTHWSWVSHPVLLGWWSGMTLLTVARAFLVAQFKKSPIGTSASTWFTKHLAGVALSGIGWGTAGILLFTPHSLEHQVFLSLILAGMAAGAVPIFAASRKTFFAFALPACVPIIAKFLLMGDQIHMAIGVTGLLFLGIMTGLVWTINRGLVQNFELSALRTHAETELLELFEHTHDLIQSVAPDGRLLFVNRAWRETLGYTPTEIETLNIFDVLHPNDHEHCRRVLQEILAGNDTRLVEMTFRTKSGRTVIAEGHVSVRVENNRPAATRGIFRNITERKVAETRLLAVNQNLEHLVTERTGKLRESETLYRNLVSTVPGAVYEFQIDAAGRRAFPFMSQGIADLIGLSPDECMANADVAFQRILPDALPAVEASIRHSLENLSPWLHEFPAKTLSGETKWLRGHSVPHRDNDGTTHWQGVLIDVTARKRAEEALRASEERFRASYHNASVGMSICDLDGRIQEVNEALCHILGYSKQELLAKDFQSLTHPKDLPGNMDRIRWLLAGTVTHQVFEKRYIRKDGATVWAQVGLSIIRNRDNVPSHLLAMVQDITERKQAESRLRTTQHAIDHATDSIFVIGSNGYFLDVNESACRRLGYTKQELLSKSVLDIDPDFSPAVWETFWAEFTQQKQLRIETRHRSKSGEVYPVEVVANYIEHEGKELDYAFVRDITERKQAEAALQASQNQIQQMQKMEAIGQLAGGIAHDFNNILTAILGNAEIAVLKSEADHPARPNLARILEAGQRASHVVQQILTFTRQQDVSRTILPLAPVVTEAFALLHATLPVGIEFTHACDAATPHILANATQLQQVLMNLCTNAWHALGDTPGRIAIDLDPIRLTRPLSSPHATLSPGLYARLSVRDTGCGMPPETIARIFDPFFTTKPLGQGTGLGLSVVLGIVQSHDGAIVVESVPGQGTAFRLYFPAAETPAPASAPTQAPHDPVPRRTCHLLYLDDEEMLVELVRALFEAQGYRVTGCTNTAEALAAVRADPDGFDVVVTDYNMPEMSGLEVARELADIRPALPVVLVSGYLTPTDQSTALAANIKEIVYKPTLLQELGAVLTRLLDNQPSG